MQTDLAYELGGFESELAMKRMTETRSLMLVVTAMLLGGGGTGRARGAGGGEWGGEVNDVEIAAGEGGGEGGGGGRVSGGRVWGDYGEDRAGLCGWAGEGCPHHGGRRRIPAREEDGHDYAGLPGR